MTTVTSNPTSLSASPTLSARLTPGLTSSPGMSNKIGSPVAAGNAVSTSLSPNMKAASTVIGNTGTPGALASSNITQSPVAGSVNIRQSPGSATEPTKVLDKKRLHELVKEVDPLEQLDDDVEEMLMQIADDFIDNVVTAACQLAKHRKSSTVEVKDVQLHLERNWNMWIPGFGSEELKPYKKSATTEAHKQRLALIKKTLKKY